jgi:hypothetical protein
MTSSHDQHLFWQALAQVKPDYFTWSEAEQERYGATLPKADKDQLLQLLYEYLFDLPTRSDDLEAAYQALSHAQLDRLNPLLLHLEGIGKDKFDLNDFKGKGLLEFETLYDYDDYRMGCAQEKQEPPKPYTGQLYGTFARVSIQGIFHYAYLLGLAEYLFSELDELGRDHIATLLPHDYKPGKEHGKRESGATRWERRLDAGGLEGQLEELRERFYTHLLAHRETLTKRFDQTAEGKVYRILNPSLPHPHITYVFSDKTALQAVRLKHFVADCETHQGSAETLAALLQAEKQNLIAFLNNTYQEVMATYDPKIIKFRKKYKVYLTDQALEDLSKLD